VVEEHDLTFKQLEKFAKRINYDVPVVIKLCSGVHPFAARAFPRYTLIYLCRSYWKWWKNKNQGVVIKSLFVHEIGHFHTGGTGSKSKDELAAELWAFRRLKQLKMFKIRQWEIKTFRKTWGNPKKKKRAYKRYYMAWRMFKEQKMRY
jgi:hypothetical protein